MESSITDANGLEVNQARLRVELEAVSESLGSLFIPLLTTMTQTMIGAIANARDLGSNMEQVFIRISAVVVDAAKEFGIFVKMLADAASGNYKGAFDDLKDGASGMPEMFKDAQKAVEG